MAKTFNPRDGSIWATALIQDHARRAVQERSVAYEIAETFYLDPDAVDQFGLIDTLLDGKALRAVLSILNHPDVCGVSLKELEENKTDGSYVAYIITVLNIFKAMLAALTYEREYFTHKTKQGGQCGCQRCRLIEEFVLSLSSGYPEFAQTLWSASRSALIPYIDGPLLVFDEDNGDVAETNLKEALASIHFCLDVIHSSKPGGSYPAPPTMRLELCSARLMFAIWTHSQSQNLREYVLVFMTNTLAKLDLPMCQDFVRDVTDGQVASRADVHAQAVALLRKGTITRDPSFNFTSALLRWISIFHPESTMYMCSSASREIFWYHMAAFRRYWCSTSSTRKPYDARKDSNISCIEDDMYEGIKGMTGIFSAHIWKVFTIIKSKSGYSLRIPELWIYEVVHVLAALIANIAASRVENLTGRAASNADVVIRGATTVLSSLCILLQYYQRCPSDRNSPHWVMRYPPSDRVLAFTRTLWQDTRDLLRARRAHQRRPIQELHHHWVKLGEELARSERLLSSAKTPPPEPLERCGYRGCACSVFKAVHPMRICCGCWSVAYCNGHCQTRDWDYHREVCNRGGSRV